MVLHVLGGETLVLALPVEACCMHADGQFDDRMSGYKT